MDPRTDSELMAIANAFTLRVRRIEAHSLLTDEAGISHLAGSGFVMRRKDGVASLERHLPMAGASFGIDQRFAAAAVRTAQLALLAETR